MLDGDRESLRQLTHQLSNELAALHMWLRVLEHTPSCADCEARQAEARQAIARLNDGALELVSTLARQLSAVTAETPAAP
jgi:hypothetical protein